jgi:serine/threonine-protein kinase
LSVAQQELVLAGRFRVRAQIGYATLGWLYHAFDLERGSDVALRMVLGVPDPDAARRRLAEHIDRLSAVHHRGLAAVFDCGVDGGQLWFASEWVHGRSLEQEVAEKGPLLAGAVADLGIEVARALGDAHDRGLVHRGLKTRNIFLTDGRAVVLELGVAATILSDGALLANTPSSMPPEQVLSRAMDHRGDIYSLGCCLFTALVGKPPFDGTTGSQLLAAQNGWRAPRARDLNPSVPEPLELVLLQAMAQRPEDRFQSMTEFSEALSRSQRAPRRIGP